ncbi:nucleoside/nucleotide kinase family protein [Carbonactinospora thermoautotrophica]|uniref:nucleoside/nucleotide kinase family protein n=1 Tax=Carbonactinospora thermoautotrophica TaxID=1469144 RepID=UPI00227197EE|nr:nucleoside/nucleotide kinase family protein [Carbonactinospora thermoautotrophica]MCX9192205.1 nucleoside/nucleotide kinase family protein [Carbonactinospora thermoautotrophica]
MTPPVESSFDALVERARALARRGTRTILGITGPPGAGKSTLAERIVAALDGSACLVPMDGFHLANAELVRLGRRERKGAHDTFDAAGYVALLRRLRDGQDTTVYAPLFLRDIEEPIAGAIPIPPDVPLVVTEGNYLLLRIGPWAAVRDLLDEVWYCAPDEQARITRLIARHEAYGKPPEAARAWALGSDQRNAELVAETRDLADLLVRLP